MLIKITVQKILVTKKAPPYNNIALFDMAR